jgi:hypothetical protein
MTTGNCIHFNVSRSTAFRDAIFVAFLAVVLGAFVAQVSSAPRTAHRSVPVAAVTLDGASNG